MKKPKKPQQSQNPSHSKSQDRSKDDAELSEDDLEKISGGLMRSPAMQKVRIGDDDDGPIPLP
jgi:hypothetical protein